MTYNISGSENLQTTDLFLVSILLHFQIFPKVKYIDRTVLFEYPKPDAKVRGVFADFTYATSAPKLDQLKLAMVDIKEVRNIYDNLRGQVIDWMKTGKEIKLNEN